MRRAGWVMLATLAAAGCAGPPAPRPAPEPTRPLAVVPPPIRVAPAAPISPVPPPAPDQCGAYLLAGLVGKPRSEIPVPVDPSRRRVICSTCPRTPEFAPYRLTIEYDATTGRVTKVGCG